jgi:hypothetical protein
VVELANFQPTGSYNMKARSTALPSTTHCVMFLVRVFHRALVLNPAFGSVVFLGPASYCDGISCYPIKQET